MKEEGKITKILPGGIVEVEISPSDACLKCKACQLGYGDKMFTQAKNEIGAKVGDKIEVEVTPAQTIGASFLVFIVPLLGLILGYFLGAGLAKILTLSKLEQGFGVFFALSTLVLAGFFLKIFDQYLGKHKKFISRIVRITNG